MNKKWRREGNEMDFRLNLECCCESHRFPHRTLDNLSIEARFLLIFISATSRSFPELFSATELRIGLVNLELEPDDNLEGHNLLARSLH